MAIEDIREMLAALYVRERYINAWKCLKTMERETGIEPATSSLGSWHSTAELLPLAGCNTSESRLDKSMPVPLPGPGLPAAETRIPQDLPAPVCRLKHLGPPQVVDVDHAKQPAFAVDDHQTRDL